MATTNSVALPPTTTKRVAAYNRLLLSAAFYAAFRDYDYVLIYQLDCLVFSSDLDRWCDRGWDYAGAPWFLGYQAGPDGGLWRAGNGGLSLRRVEAFSSLLGRPDVRAFLESYQGQEDVFWSIIAKTFEPRFSVPEPQEAIAFSIESHPRHCFALAGNALPFGCHYWNRVDREFWETFLARGVRPLGRSAQAVLDDQRHPDHAWARASVTRLLDAIAVTRDEEQILLLMTVDLRPAALNSPPTREGMQEAFARVFSEPAPADWLAFWVGKPHLTLRQAYRDLIRGPGFQQRRDRIARR